MMDQEFLLKIAEGVITKEEERTHLEETGAALIHFDFEILKIDEPKLTSGRSGDYYKFSFEYELSFLDDQHLMEAGNEVRIYKRALRLSPDGNVVGIGERVALLD